VLSTLTALVLVSGCGGRDGLAPDRGSDARSEVDRPAARRTSTSMRKDLGSLSRFLGWDWETVNMEDPFLQDRAEELVAACMASRNLEYQAVNYSAAYQRNRAWAERATLPPEEYASRYGFGVATSFEGKLPQIHAEDPNEERMEKMGEAERRAYQQALFGEAVATGGRAGTGAGKQVSFGGCKGDAARQLLGGGGAEKLLAKYQQLTERIETDPRLAKAYRRWSGCMARAGHRHATPKEAEAQAVTAFHQLLREALAAGPPKRAEDGRMAVEVDQARLAQVRAAEVDTAVADQRCRARHHLEAVRSRVKAEHERRFIEENRDQLERQRDALRRMLGSAR
jgi:hypothetical protein